LSSSRSKQFIDVESQQRLVTLGLKVRRAMDHLPAGLDGLNAELSDVACGLTAVLEDRRRTSFFP
jgi:hypothetical protein